MKSSTDQFGRILGLPSQYVIPIFQRNYRWEKPQWDKLWENLVEIQALQKTGNHFMGFLVFMSGLAQPGQLTKFYLVDGQQRLATLSILLAAIRNVAREVDQKELADEIHESYLVHPYKKGDQHYRLLPKERDYDCYLSLVKGQGNVAGLMTDALGYFEEKLRDYTLNRPEQLRHVFDVICQRFEFTLATLETENAYNIFKSLNSTGVPLGPADLIRNFVFMHILPEDQEEFDHDLWQPLEDRFTHPNGTLDEERFSKFFRDFLMSKPDIGYVRLDETFAKFEAQYEATAFSPQELASALNVNARYYAVISGQAADQNTQVAQALASLNQLESSTTYPLLLALFQKRADGAMTSEQLACAVNMLSGFILRRFVCGENSRGYGRIFVRAVGEKGDDPIKTLESFLLGRGWPDDRRFKAAFVEFPLYLRDYDREILVALERNQGHKEPADLTSAQIEHILPQTLNADWRKALGPDAELIHAEWLNRPGNLTLSAYNQDLWNHSFEKKRERYAQSNIGLTRELAAYAHWTESEIRKRGERLAEKAAQIWMGPKEPTAVIQPDLRGELDEDDLTKTQQLRLDFWTEFLAQLCGVSTWAKARKPSRDAWMGFGIGHGAFYLDAFMSVRNRQVGVMLAIGGPHKAWYYEQLHDQQQAIESELHETLTWIELPDKKSSYVSLYLRDSDPRDRSKWPEQHQWLIDKLGAFRRCFSDRVKSLHSVDES